MKKLLVLVVGIGCLAMPSSAFGQATRTWVSGVGSDANPCSRTAPCQTWAGAISKTAAGGEISALDPGGFGGVTITKPITLDGKGHIASALAAGAGVNGITISLDPGAVGNSRRRVILRNIEVQGAGGALPDRGIRVVSHGAGHVHIENVRISNFSICGVCIEPGGAGTAGLGSRVTLVDSHIADITNAAGTAGDGVRVQPAANAGLARLTMRNTKIYGAVNGVKVLSPAAPARVGLFDNFISEVSESGVLADGTEADISIGRNDIVHNGQGLRTLNSGSITSFGNNFVFGNGVDGVPTTTIAPR